MRARLMAVTLVVAGSLAAGCGSDGDPDGSTDAPQSATTAEFCDAYNSLYDSFDASKPPSDSESVQAIKDWADELDATGTPEDIPADARTGFGVILETIGAIPDDATQDDVQKITDGLSDADQQASEAFGKWATETCPMEMPETPESSGSPGEDGSSSAP